MTVFSISTIDAQQAAAVRRTVPTAEHTTPFVAGSSQVMRAATEQGDGTGGWGVQLAHCGSPCGFL